jgi:hypothetical protein
MLDINNHFSMDYELWGRFLIAGAVFQPVHKTLGVFRVYEGQKISDRHITTKSLIHTASELITDCPDWEAPKKRFYKRLLFRFAVKYYYGHLRSIIGIRRRIKYFLQRSGIRDQGSEIRDQGSEIRDQQRG